MTERIKRAAEATRASLDRVLGTAALSPDETKLLGMIRTCQKLVADNPVPAPYRTEVVMLLSVLEDHFEGRVRR